jgi:hypothetical protein
MGTKIELLWNKKHEYNGNKATAKEQMESKPEQNCRMQVTKYIGTTWNKTCLQREQGWHKRLESNLNVKQSFKIWERIY